MIFPVPYFSIFKVYYTYHIPYLYVCKQSDEYFTCDQEKSLGYMYIKKKHDAYWEKSDSKVEFLIKEKHLQIILLSTL